MGSRPEEEVATMSPPGIFNSVTILLLTMSSSMMAQDDPYPACYQFFSTWNQVYENASTGIHSDIASAQSCQLLCVEDEDCVAFSWHFGSDQFDENTCQLFSEIGEETSSCADCVSGPKSCTCSSDVACSVDAEYLVHLQLEVSLEEECQDLCVADPECSWYSWYSSTGDPFQNACAMLSKCVGRQEVDDGSIKSGRAICNNLMRLPLMKFPECTDYYELNSFTRNIKTEQGGVGVNEFCGHQDCCDQVNHPHPPPDCKGSTWYRFAGGAGSRLAETRPGTKHCGTACAGYLFDGHPSEAEGIVSRTVYFECSSNAKYDPVSIEVLNCGDYYVYHLPDTPNCYEGFCGIE